jgi:hypothetical protein
MHTSICNPATSSKELLGLYLLVAMHVKGLIGLNSVDTKKLTATVSRLHSLTDENAYTYYDAHAGLSDIHNCVLHLGSCSATVVSSDSVGCNCSEEK